MTQPQLAGMQQPKTSDLKISSDHPPLDSESMVGELWKSFEDGPKNLHELARDYSPYFGDYSHEYNVVNLQWRDRGFSFFNNDAKSREV